MKSGDPSSLPLETVNEVPEAETPPKKPLPPPPSWAAWCDRNSKPVKRRKPPNVQMLTRWQKQGPMMKKDWKAFAGWALLRAMPREPKLPKPEKPPCPADYLPCGRKKRKLEKDELEERMGKLAKPRKITEKFQMTHESPAYSPVIFWGQPPHHDPGRPFKPPRVPGCFPNDELEADFWSQLRFPVRQAALWGQATPRILSLSKPRRYPPHPHCPIPYTVRDPLDEEPPPRKKFTRRGWRLHQIRLIYLSKPVVRPETQVFFYTL